MTSESISFLEVNALNNKVFLAITESDICGGNVPIQTAYLRE